MTTEASTIGALMATFKDTAEGIYNRADATVNSKSLIGTTGSRRNEPVVYIDETIKHIPEITNILQTLQSAYAGILILAIETLVGTVNGVQVAKILDPLNPNRDPDYRGYIENISKHVARESVLFDANSYRYAFPTGSRFTEMAREAEVAVTGAGADSRLNQTIQDASNLVAGKLLNIPVTDTNGAERHITVQLRMRVTAIDQAVMATLVGDETANATFKSRVEDFVRGHITATDLIFCRDIYRERRRILIKDKTDVIRTIRNRQLQHKKAGVTSGKASLNEMSNMYVISKETADLIGAKFGYDFQKPEHRRAIFNNTSGLIIVVVDQEEERVKFYYESITDPTSLSFNDCKSAAKGNGPNIMDVFAAYKEGARPSF